MQRSNFTLIHKPMSVAREQCGTVGLNSTLTTLTLPTAGSFTYNKNLQDVALKKTASAHRNAFLVNYIEIL